MSLLQAAVLGLIEGVTEFLPISSTGHLILAAEFLGLTPTEFLKSFEVVVQSGAILAVLVLYFKRLFLSFKVFWRVAVAFLPTALLGLLFYKIIKQYLLGNTLVVIGALFLGGLFIILAEWWFKNRLQAKVLSIEAMSWQQAILIGIFQSFAFIPGVSRSAATVIGGMFLGLSRSAVVEFSFLLAIPTMLAATGLDLIKSANVLEQTGVLNLGAGFLVAFLTALFVIKWLVKFVQTNTFTGFAYYRIVLAIICFFVLF
ncbi:MAG: undecaprenyl-diphosphatase UppP [Candidatus Magasanikbacteria bacterium]|nr:undecaprenyl-diphosphatase UppP [Candidatus Magasanikbacteria bacterium]